MQFGTRFRHDFLRQINILGAPMLGPGSVQFHTATRLWNDGWWDQNVRKLLKLNGVARFVVEGHSTFQESGRYPHRALRG
jgi:hypothetical protein